MNCYVIKNRNVSFVLRFAVNLSQWQLVTMSLLFSRPMPSPSLKQHRKERLSPRFCLRERGAVHTLVHRLVTMEQMYKSVFDSSSAPSPSSLAITINPKTCCFSFSTSGEIEDRHLCSDWNSGPPNYNCSALTTLPASLLSHSLYRARHIIFNRAIFVWP